MAIVGLSWICLCSFGAVPLYLSKVVPSYADAFFEIVSGFTTTGASIFPDVEILPRGILFWRSLTHWLGGMGIIVLYIALLPSLGSKSYQLYEAETSGLPFDRIEPRLKDTAKSLWKAYLYFSIILLLLLIIGGVPVFDALCHMFGTISTGGFSTKNASLAAYNPYIQWVVIIFMFIGGINFLLHCHALKGDFRDFLKDEEFRFYLFLVLFSVGFFALILHFGDISSSPLRDSTFQVVSILTATGFASTDFNRWPEVLRILLVVLMFIGGCGGSTSGGLKIVRFLLCMKIGVQSIVQTIFPNAVLPVKFNTKPLSEKFLATVLIYFVGYTSVLVVGAVLFIITDNCDMVTAISASASALGNVGPGLNKVGPMVNYAWVSIPGKWLLSFLMLAGRLELYSLLILFFPFTWRR